LCLTHFIASPKLFLIFIVYRTIPSWILSLCVDINTPALLIILLVDDSSFILSFVNKSINGILHLANVAFLLDEHTYASITINSLFNYVIKKSSVLTLKLKCISNCGLIPSNGVVDCVWWLSKSIVMNVDIFSKLTPYVLLITSFILYS
jgi:hypothetical protein